ncbi:MAG: hypothetical protein CMJ58_01345 [Planctomycetaceae bacterium]|nr:hypothetical protein [Planctomycetaceae bacterium]
MAKRRKAAEPAPIDLRTARVAIEGEDDPLAGLAKLRDWLESEVSPYVTDPGPVVITFRGETAGLAAGWTAKKAAVLALQQLYKLLPAIEAGDAVTAAHYAFGVGASANEALLDHYGGGKAVVDRWAANLRCSRGGLKGASATNEGTAKIYSDQYEAIAEAVDAKVPDIAPGYSYQTVTDEVAKRFNVSGRHVRDVYKELRGGNPKPHNKGRKR